MIPRSYHTLVAASLLVCASHKQDVGVEATRRLKSTAGIEEECFKGRVLGLTFPIAWKPADAPEDAEGLAVARTVHFAGSRGVRRWQIARAPGGRFVVLAGGVDSAMPLQIFWFDLQTGEGVVEALWVGGLALPPSFHAPAGSVGSWPVFVAGIAMFAFEDKGNVMFRAQGFHQDLRHAAVVEHKDLAAVDRFQVVPGEREHFLGIRFPVPHDPIEFEHPDAPKLIVDSPALVFEDTEPGERQTRRIVLRNAGARPLHVELRVKGGEGVFRLHGSDKPKTVLFCTPLTLRVDFVPTVAGEWSSSLVILTDGVGETRQIELRGRSLTAEPNELVAAAADAALKSAATTGTDAFVRMSETEAKPPVEAPAEVAVPKPVIKAGPLEVLSAEELQQIRIRPTGLGTVRVSGLVARRGVELLVRRRGATETVWRASVSRGRVSVDILASPGQALEVALARQGTHPRQFLVLGVVPPVLREQSGARGSFVRIQGAPRMNFLLSRVILDARGVPLRVLRTWRGRFDDFGVVRLPSSTLLAADRSDVDLVVTVEAKNSATGELQAVHSPVLHLRAPSHSHR